MELKNERCRVCYRLWLADYGNLINDLCATCKGEVEAEWHKTIDQIIENEKRCLKVEKGRGFVSV